MSQSIKLLTDEDALHWPKLCARCGAAEPLRSGEALIAATRSARQNPGGGISMGSDVLSVDYPVCDRHAKFLSLAQWLTRDTLAPRVVRGFCYAIGSASLLALGIKLLALLLAAFGILRGIETSAPRLAIELVFALLLVLVVWAYRVTPVRLTRLESDAVTIRFRFNPYAQAFAQANTKIVVKRRTDAR